MVFRVILLFICTYKREVKNMLYELVLRGRLFGVQTINRFNYVLTGTPAVVSGSFALTHAFMNSDGGVPAASSVLGQLLDIVTTDWQATEIETRNIYDPVDFYTLPFLEVVAGEQTGKTASPLVSYGFRTNRVRADISRGTKRFAGVTEAGIDDGGVIGPAFLPALQELAEAMTATLPYTDEGNSLSFAPAVVQKEKVALSEGRFTYRYYPTLSEQMDHVALGVLWEAYNTVRSQTSRQYGRGN